VVELGIPELTDKQFGEVCEEAEKAARKQVLTQISSKLLDKMDIIVEVEGTKPVNITVEIDLVISKQAKFVNQMRLADEAVRKAFEAIETYLRKLKNDVH